MELRHLRYFAAVAETLHFGRAGEQLRDPCVGVAAREQEQDLLLAWREPMVRDGEQRGDALDELVVLLGPARRDRVDGGERLAVGHDVAVADGTAPASADGWVASGVTTRSMYGNSRSPESSSWRRSLSATSKTLTLAYSPTMRGNMRTKLGLGSRDELRAFASRYALPS